MNEPEVWRDLVNAFATIRFNVVSNGQMRNHLYERLCFKHIIPNTQLSIALFNQWLTKSYEQHWELLDGEDWCIFDQIMPDLLTLKCLHS